MARTLPRLLPPLVLFAGLLLFGLGIFALGIEAAGEEPRPLDASSLTATNGTALLVYPTSYRGGSDRVEVSYQFPAGTGDAYVVSCDDLAAMRRGDEPAAPLLTFSGQRSGRFVLSDDNVPGPVTCHPSVVFRWSVTGADSGEGRPAASVTAHRSSFDAGRHWVVVLVLAAGVALALAGGLAWARARSEPPRMPATNDSTVEALRGSLDRMGEQLERTRKHLLLAGIVGVFLWYPVLLPWAWKRAALTGVDPLFPWAVSGIVLGFLLVLTLLWARELHGLDRELAAWRGRMGELRKREEELIVALEEGR